MPVSSDYYFFFLDRANPGDYSSLSVLDRVDGNSAPSTSLIVYLRF